MDMTNSLAIWQGKIVGIIRAELEIAQNLKKEHPAVRFSVFANGRFTEIAKEDLNWLFSADSATRAYLAKMGRDKAPVSPKPKEAKSARDMLLEKYAGALSGASLAWPGRRERIVRGVKLLLETLPERVRPFAGLLAKGGYIPLRFFLFCAGKLTRPAGLGAAAQRPADGAKGPGGEIKHPYGPGDVVFAAGWLHSGKEEGFAAIKENMPSLRIAYLIYDLVALKEGVCHFYPDEHLKLPFQRYFAWASRYCDLLIYGGETARRDGAAYQAANGLPVPQSLSVRFGAAIAQNKAEEIDRRPILAKYGLREGYLLTVGSIEPRKNYDVLYKAYVFLKEKYPARPLPQIAIAGSPFPGLCADLLDNIKRDPRVKGNIVLVAPTDEELHCLYKHCRFFLLPSFYEGWSLTLPEAMSYGKFCLVSDVAPLREIGKDLVDYLDPLNPVRWAEAIAHYLSRPDLVAKRESHVINDWRADGWQDCARAILRPLNSLAEKREGSLYCDMTVSFYQALGGYKMSGVLRSELMLARNFNKNFPRMQYFAFQGNKYLPLRQGDLAEILGDGEMDAAFEIFRRRAIEIAAKGNLLGQTVWQPDNRQRLKESFWLLCSALAPQAQYYLIKAGVALKKAIYGEQRAEPPPTGLSPGAGGGLRFPFARGDVVFSAGSGIAGEHYHDFLALKKETGFKYAQVIYDFTPVLAPHLHNMEAVGAYTDFIHFASKVSDMIFYGGKTAMQDGAAYQRRQGLPVPPALPVRFGGDIAKNIRPDKRAEENTLKALGVTDKFILMVGTLEIRKNHETIYKAYLKLLQEAKADFQIVMAGHPGWKARDFFEILRRDERVKNKILTFSPDDGQLAVLYRNCRFTVLASLYEGWSLVLPESFRYGKFCLAADVVPLRETGGDFADYVNPWDTGAWAEKIHWYLSRPQELRAREEKIAGKWRGASWQSCADEIGGKLQELLRAGLRPQMPHGERSI
jgi:glycosyltransferase involved in cell wall biosynthesis